MSDPRLVTDAEAAEVASLSDGFMSDVQNLLYTRQRLIEVLEDSGHSGYDKETCVPCALLAELHNTGGETG